MRIQRVKYHVSRCMRQLSLAYALPRAALSKYDLPPGRLVDLDQMECRNQRFLLEQVSRYGPIFKAVRHRKLIVCVVGLADGRRCLKDHAADLMPVSLAQAWRFPERILRQMEGDAHRTCRKAVVEVVRPELIDIHESDLNAIIREGLTGYARADAEGFGSSKGLIRALDSIASGMLVQIFLGARYRTAAFQDLMALYHAWGPDGFVWNSGKPQQQASAKIRDVLLRASSNQSGDDNQRLSPCVLQCAVEQNTLDDTILGNIMFMVEMGRFDMHCLFRWIIKCLVESPDLLTRIASEDSAAPGNRRSLAEAVVLETLRLAQSERLMRVARRDIIFNGYLIPRFAYVRICLWESHKSPETFPDPFVFDPERFLNRDYAIDQYAPFGLDHHRCLASEIVIRLSTMFIRTLASSYTLKPLDDGPIIRGEFHWQPSDRFTVRLQERQVGGDACG